MATYSVATLITHSCIDVFGIFDISVSQLWYWALVYNIVALLIPWYY